MIAIGTNEAQAAHCAACAYEAVTKEAKAGRSTATLEGVAFVAGVAASMTASQSRGALIICKEHGRDLRQLLEIYGVVPIDLSGAVPPTGLSKGGVA